MGYYAKHHKKELKKLQKEYESEEISKNGLRQLEYLSGAIEKGIAWLAHYEDNPRKYPQTKVIQMKKEVDKLLIEKRDLLKRLLKRDIVEISLLSNRRDAGII